MSIPEGWRRFKLSRYDLALVAIVLLVGVGCFGLGRLAAITASKPELQFGAIDLSDTPVGGYAHFVDNRAQNNQTVRTGQGGSTVPQGVDAVVAAKGGEAYHLLNCPGAAHIKEENRIYFASPAAATAAGYRPAKNCPGLK
jgi:hypothetical protein